MFYFAGICGPLRILILKFCLNSETQPANTQSPEVPAAANIHLYVSPCLPSASVCTAST